MQLTDTHQYREARDMLLGELDQSLRFDDATFAALKGETVSKKLADMVTNLTDWIDSLHRSVVVRPNGKTYRAAKAPTVVRLTEAQSLAVLRTHDVDVARMLVSLGNDVSELGRPRQVWLASVVDRRRPGRTWYHDSERGVPAVMFLA